MNGRLTVEDLIPIGAGSLSVSLWAKNIFDRTYAMAETQLSGRGLAGVMNAVYNEPATYGIEARIRF
ncbi:MAG: hypothetical protein M0R03_07375 [Novosphingobium sp.]|nr:hypothetical protein [Novosphingobium sp.]